jgi:hypothetical protein
MTNAVTPFKPKPERSRHRHAWRVLGIKAKGADVTEIAYQCADPQCRKLQLAVRVERERESRRERKRA